MSVAKNAMSVTEGKVEKAGVRIGTEKGGNGELCELHLGFARDV